MGRRPPPQAARSLLDGRVRAMIAGRWIDQAQNPAIDGPAGIGNNWLACAFGQKACRDSPSPSARGHSLRKQKVRKSPPLDPAQLVMEGSHTTSGRATTGLHRIRPGNGSVRTTWKKIDMVTRGTGRPRS